MASSGYTIWSVIAGEQPTTAKWNILGANDASFNSGVGLNDGAISGRVIAPGAITLGYAETATSFNTTSGTPVQATGLTVTVTIPAGGRKIKITGFCRSLVRATSYSGFSIWDGAVNAGGTLLGRVYSGNASDTPAIVMAVKTPSAGSKTYNLGLEAIGGGTATITAATNEPAFILVEAV